MSRVSKNAEHNTQEIYSSSSNTSSANEDRTSTGKSSDPVELHSLENVRRPASRTVDGHDSVGESTPSRSSSYLSTSRSQGVQLDQRDPRTIHATTPRWYSPATIAGQPRLTRFLTRTKLLIIWNWICGPSPPRKISFNPFFPRWQSLPSRYLSKLFGKRRGELIFVIVCFVLWLIVFSILLARSAIGALSGFSDQQPLRLSCIAELWDNAPTCGIDGKNCEPFEGQPFAFLCPSNCLSALVYEPYTVGDEEVIYRPLVIGGPNVTGDGSPVYRGDSFICGAAIHAGVITNERGGCGLYTRRGNQRNFASTESNGITSVGFPSSFPLSFSVSSIDANCEDPQWTVFAVSVLFTSLISLVVSSAVVFTATIFVVVFFQIGLISSAPYYIDYPEVISTAFSRFLPAAFIAVVIYRYCISHTLTRLDAPWERTILWLGGCWVGAMNDYTFDKIPIRRLTAHDLQQQPGAIVALVIIVLVIVVIAIGQIWFYRLEGRLPQYLAFYICLGIIIGCLTSIPSLEFRLHHYVLALLLLPGTALQTRPTLLYQGLLVGLFINGVARWGFASILQTPASLLGDAQRGSALPTDIIHDIVNNTIQFTIDNIADGYDGVSVLVNDVERFQESRIELPAQFNWSRTDPEETLFFRFAFTATYRLGGVLFGDFTKPGIWYGNGTWREMLPGPSR